MNIFFRKTIDLLSPKVSLKQKIVFLSNKPLPSMNFINNNIFNQHPSVLEAEKLFTILEKDYENKMTDLCHLGEERLRQ